MITKAQVREVASFDPARNLVTSMYLKIGAGERTLEQCVLATDYLLRQQRHELQYLSDSRLAAIDEDAEAIRRYVSDDLGDVVDRHVNRGIAVFSCHRKNFWRAIPFASNVVESVDTATFPNLVPLVDILEKAAPIGVILVDREKARFFVVELDHIREGDALIDYFADRVPPDDIHTGKREHRVDEHLRHVADAIGPFMEREGGEWMLLGGVHELLPELRRLLPREVGSRIKAYLAGVPVIAPEREVLRAAQPMIGEVRENETESLLMTAFDRDAPADKAVTDIESVLDAASRAALSVLLIERDFHISGAACKTCGRLSTLVGPTHPRDASTLVGLTHPRDASTSVDRCPRCGGTDTGLMSDLVPPLVVQALIQDADVQFVSASSPWARRHHIGAVLRYALTTADELAIERAFTR